jgi:Trk-type K+ transport system membrane component
LLSEETTIKIVKKKKGENRRIMQREETQWTEMTKNLTIVGNVIIVIIIVELITLTIEVIIDSEERKE